MILLALFCFLLGLLDSTAGQAAPLQRQVTSVRVTNVVYMNISICGVPQGQLRIACFGEIAPITCKNFVELSKRTLPNGYAGSKFHRIIKGFVVQGGDFTRQDGTGGRSIYGDKFKDEPFILRHYGRYWLNMANAGPDTNGSQFCFMLNATPHLDGKHVVFAKVYEGMDIVDKMEVVRTNNERPVCDVLITASGEISLIQPTPPGESAQGQDSDH